MIFPYADINVTDNKSNTIRISQLEYHPYHKLRSLSTPEQIKSEMCPIEMT